MKNIVKILRLFATLNIIAYVLCLSNCLVFAEDNYYTYEIKDGYAIITAVNTDINGVVSIPSNLDGYTVKGIGKRAFYNCKNIIEIYIPNGIETIGDTAFGYCRNLEKVEMADTVTEISRYAFRNCDKMTSMKLSENIKELSMDVFNNCRALTKIEIPEKVEIIRNYAFRNCISLEEVSIAKNVKSIGSGAFTGCDSLSKINVDEGNEKYCSDNGVLFSKDKKTLEYYPSAYGSVYIIPDTVLYIGNEAFRGNRNIETVTIPSSVSEVTTYMFSGCTKLLNINVSENNEYLSSINGVLYSKDKSKLFVYPAAQPQNYTLPDATIEIAQTAFSDSSIYNLYVSDKHQLFTSYDGVLFNKNRTELIMFPRGRSGKYVVPSGVNIIGRNSFIYCDNLTEIVLPNSLTEVEDWAFCGCAGLTDINIPESVVHIGSKAFSDCMGISEIILKGSTVNIEESAFDNCTKTKKIVLAEGTEAINVSCFYNCSSLESIYIPKSVKKIEAGAFGNIYTNLKVLYGGTKEEWGTILIEERNDILYEAEISYNILYPEIKYISYETEIVDNNVVFSIMPINSPGNTLVVLAVYDENERLIGSTYKNFNGEAVKISAPKDFYNRKIFLWDNFKSLTPVCGYVKVEE